MKHPSSVKYDYEDPKPKNDKGSFGKYVRNLWCLLVHTHEPVAYSSKDKTFRCMKCGSVWKRS
jgi:hypothetical protein